MAAAVEIKFDEVKMKRLQRMFRTMPGKLPQVMSRAINKTSKSAKTQIVKELRKDINSTAKGINKAIRSTRATTSTWQSIINILDRRIPLISFKAKPTKKGTTYKVRVSGGRELAESAFIQTMKSGHKGVCKRKRGVKRNPIRELFGPAPGKAFEGASGIAANVTAEAYKNLEKNIDSQIDLILHKLRRSA